MEAWHAGIARAREARRKGMLPPAEAERQTAFAEYELKECRKRMAALRGKGRKPWTFKTR